MKLVMTLLVRDEADIVEDNLRYHASAGVDEFVVTDNGSVDGTLDRLRAFAHEFPLHLFREPPADFSQHRWVTRMARFASEGLDADWVINADADEFFVSRSADLKTALANSPSEVGILLVGRHNFVPLHPPATPTPVPHHMRFRKARSCHPGGALLAPKAIHRGDPGVVVPQGNHKAIGPLLGPAAPLGSIEVFHFPIRSYSQFERKVRNAGSGYAINAELSPKDGFHKRRWYALLQAGQLEAEFRNQHFYPEARLREGLASGEILEDARLANRLGPR